MDRAHEKFCELAFKFGSQYLRDQVENNGTYIASLAAVKDKIRLVNALKNYVSSLDPTRYDRFFCILPWWRTIQFSDPGDRSLLEGWDNAISRLAGFYEGEPAAEFIAAGNLKEAVSAEMNKRFGMPLPIGPGCIYYEISRNDFFIQHHFDWKGGLSNNVAHEISIYRHSFAEVRQGARSQVTPTAKWGFRYLCGFGAAQFQGLRQCDVRPAINHFCVCIDELDKHIWPWLIEIDRASNGNQ